MDIVVIIYCIYKTIKIIVSGNDYNRDELEISLLNIRNLFKDEDKFKTRINNIILETEQYVKKYDLIRYDKNVIKFYRQ